MEEDMDPWRGTPLMGNNLWASGDMYHLGGSSSGGDGGASSGGMNARLRFDESGESSTGLRMGHPETGKGPESSRPPVRKSSQVSPKLVVSRSSGGRRVQRPQQGIGPAPWTVLHGLVGGADDGGAEAMGVEDDGNLGMGLSTHLGLSEEIIVHPAHVRPLPNAEFLGRAGRPKTNTLDFLSGRGAMHADYLGGGAHAAGREADGVGGGGRMGTGGPGPVASRYCPEGPIWGVRMGAEERGPDGGGSMGFGAWGMAHEGLAEGARGAMEERRCDMGAGSMLSDSVFTERQGHRDDGRAVGGPCNFMGGGEAFAPSGSRRQESPERHYMVSTAGGSSPESSSSAGLGLGHGHGHGHGHVGSSSSRSSACKRKSCTAVAPGYMSASRSGSPHRSGYRETYGGRAGGGSHGSSGRRTAGGGSEIMGSSSSPSEAVFLGRYSLAGAAASGLEEPVARRVNYGRDAAAAEACPESVRDGRHGKAVAGSSGGGASSQRAGRGGQAGVVLNSGGASQSPPFPRTVRRAVPSQEVAGRRTAVADPWMDADVGLPSSLLEEMMSASESRRGEGPVVGGASGSPRRREGAVGASAEERLMERYLGSSARGLASGGVGGGPLGGAGALESRLRSRVLSQHSELMSQAPHSAASHGGPASLQASVAAGGPSAPSPSRPPPHPPMLRSRLQGSSLQSLLPPPSPSPSGPAPSRVPPSPPLRMAAAASGLNPLAFAPAIESLPLPSNLFRGSLLHGSSAAGLRDRGFMSAAESLLGMPFRGLQMSAGNGGSQPRLVAEGLAEILLALERVERDEDLTYEQLLMLEATLLFGGMGLHDQHSDLRLDVDNMSYEELLALEERIGNVSTGLSSDAIEQKLKRTRYSSLDAVVAQYSEECDMKCSICQEEYEEGDELGRIECGHGYHSQCIQQWLVQKNQCPICKAAAFA